MPIAIECRQLVKTYPGTPPVEAVRGIDLEIHQGECFGLLGPNGAGKTTTVEILEGILSPSSGLVEILGMTWEKDAMSIREAIGISLQETQFSENLTIREVIELFQSFYRDPIELEAAIAKVGLEEKIDARVKTLSGGQKQRLAVASGIVGNPNILFLDEPTTGLDPSSRRQLWNIIETFKQENRTVLLTTHYMEEAEQLCDRVAIIDQGQIIRQGSPRQLIQALGGDSEIEFSIEEGDQVGLVRHLESEQAVSKIVSEKDHLMVRGNDVDALLIALSGSLKQFGCKLTNLTTGDVTLEDVFVSLTGRKLDETPDPIESDSGVASDETALPVDN